MAMSTLGATISAVEKFTEKISWNRRQDPEWLQPLLGDSPLLGRSEYEFITQVRNSIAEKVKSRPNASPDRHLKNKLSVLKRNFEEVAKYLKEKSENESYFLRNYPLWRECRDGSILQLIHIAKVVEENSKESAAARALGSTVSLAGGLLSLVPGLGLLRLAGGVLVGLGSLAAVGASVKEFQELKEKIKEAEQIMLRDKELSEKLWDWMSDISHIQEAYNTITSIDVQFMKIAKDLSACHKEKSSVDHLNTVIGKAVAALKISGWIPDDIKEVVGMLLAISMLHDSYHSLFNIALEAYKFKRALSTTYSVAKEAVKMVAVVNAGKSSKINPFRKYRLGIGIALDVISIVNATKDFEETSKEAIAIAKAAKKLQEEANVFEKLYDAVIRA